MAKDPADRYESCRAFVADAHRALLAPRSRSRRRWLAVAIVVVVAISASIGIGLVRDTNKAPAGPPAITQTSIAGAKLGRMQSFFGGWQARVLSDPGFPVLAFQTPEVAVYFPANAQPAHIITTWNRDYRTPVGIGPCSTVEEMKNTYGDKVKPSWSGTSPDGKVFQWVVGDNLVFATFLDQKVVRAVALYDGDPDNTREGSPQAYAGYVAAVETSCG